MLEEPNVDHGAISALLGSEYELSTTQITFLPLGADPHTAVYRVGTIGNQRYFLKLRGGSFEPASIAAPRYLADTGFQHVIPPVATPAGQLSCVFPPYTAVLYPYVDGHNAADQRLQEHQWIEFGAALCELHAAQIPAALTLHVPREQFSSRWRDLLRMWLHRFDRGIFVEPTSIELAAFL